MSLFKVALDYLKDQKPFVIYSKSQSDQLIGVFQKNNDLHHLDDMESSGFVFAPFAGGKAVFIPHSESEIHIEAVAPFVVSTTEVVLGYDDKAKTAFENLVKKGVAAIVNGSFEKVVFSRKETQEIESFDPITTYKKLKASYPTAFCYLFYHPKVGMWMGATPEQLVKVSDQRVYTMALAGTQVNKQQDPVVWGAKEKQEQLFVTEFIVDSLRAYLSDLTVTKPFTANAGRIMHIRTDIEGQLKNAKDLGKIIDQLHPTPAVCGMPKASSREFILQQEGYDRKFYSGYLGELNGDLALGKSAQSDLFVNLRCMEIEKNQIHLYIGCGITKDSIPTDEFMETVEKSSTMKKILEA
ncbi:chorismate-binding protein [Flavobacterium sp. NKUCC04_CG]|uniref:chorismate-binding protein n=1 Tax=Flavobacterium sp. NKUCC04_CG TaxID=2842121 RepID=UPI001C5AEED0|nr:chorismate-binding protein [Flavobacterium sp. NKUCC04_CG]MBW3520346.1 chorismate-binding protein [Flavobacterium sp. NKUCC04_CG]